MKTLIKRQRVTFSPKVYKAPYAPYYDNYKGHIFEVVEVYTDEPYGDKYSPHYKLTCVDDPSIIVNGNVHGYVLRAVKN